MKKRRTRTEIAVDVLRACIGGTRITKLLQIANIPYNAFDEYTAPLIREEFLSRLPANTRDKRTEWMWMTTPKGRIFTRNPDSSLFMKKCEK